MKVSVEARITEAQREGKESGPYVLSISPYVASEALPDIGRVRISGKISLGIPIKSKAGDKKSLIILHAPEAVNILTATIRAHIVGKRETADFIPFLAPVKKLLK